MKNINVVSAIVICANAFISTLGAKAGEVPRNVKFPASLSYSAGSKAQVLRLDFGPKSTGGYAVFNVSEVKGNPILRVSYANHPDGLGRTGCFTRETSARYLGPKFDIPALPGNINRHELYHICRTGVFVSPLIQGQERYVRIELDTPDSEVTISSFKIENAEVFRKGTFKGSFSCSDARLNKMWDISAWTCQIASFPNHDAWKCVAGFLLPRKLEAANGDGWCAEKSPCDGFLRVKCEFAANPHFPKGRFAVLVGDRRVDVEQDFTNHVKYVATPINKGERFGLTLEKESWPIIDSIEIIDASGRKCWSEDFDSSDWRKRWIFPRTLAYVADGAKRDRLIWSGDLWWAERNIFYSFNPANEIYMKGSVKLLANNQTPEGYIQACPYAERATPPASKEWGPFPSDEFAAWFVPVLYDYYLYSGDEKTLKELYPNVVRLMDYLSKHTSKDGTFIQRYETSKHAGNLQLGDKSHRSFMDILLWKCCVDAKSMAAALGDKSGEAKFAVWSEKLYNAVRAHFWDEKKGYFRHSNKNRGFGFEANALALATKFVTRNEADRIAPRFKRTGHGKFQALAVRGLMEYGYIERGLKAIEAHNWFKLLSPSWKGAQTTTECMGLPRRGWGDESHPDTAIAGIMSAEILGIEPVAPGYRTFEFCPRPSRRITNAKGTVPTPYGIIEAAWKFDNGLMEATIAVPYGTSAKVVLPKFSSLTINGEVKTGVDLLQSGTYKIVVNGVVPEGSDVLMDEGAEDKRFTYSASSSHEARSAGWSLDNLKRKSNSGKYKGWSSKENYSQRAEEWVRIDFDDVKCVEKLELWARDDEETKYGVFGFPRTFVVEGMGADGVWTKLKTYTNVNPPEWRKPFIVDLYTVIGYPKVKAVRLRTIELGTPAKMEKNVWRFQLKHIKVIL